MKKIYVTIIAMILPLLASATYIKGINYYLNSSTETATVGQGSYSGNVDIPSHVTYNGVTYTVTSIGGQSFYGSKVTSVTIPNTVTEIGHQAFCSSSLLSITIPSSVTWIDEECFKNCGVFSIYITDLEAWCKTFVHLAAFKEGSSGYNYYHRMYMNGKEITDLVIPSGVTSIGMNTFSNCTSITSVTIPNSVESIGWQAFENCSSLTSVTIPNSVSSIGYYAFSGCSSLKTVISEIENPSEINSNYIFPNEVLSSAKLIVPAGKKSAYQSTEGWKLFQNIIEVGGVGYEFVADGILYRIGMNNTVSVISGKNSCDVIIPEKVTFNGASYTVTEIGEYAFYDCSSLTSITIPNSVTSIRMYAFAYCSSLTSITIPNNVPTIWFSTFYNCSSLTSVTIGNGVEVIAEGSFEGCDNLKSVIIGTNVTFIAGYTLTQKSLKYICFTSEKLPNFDVTTTCQYIMPQTAFDGGIPQRLTNYATYSVAPKYIKVKSTTATTATLELTPIDISGGNSESTTSYEVTMYNLKPGSSVVGSWEWDGKDCGIASIPTAMTKNLVMNVQAAQAMSTTKARLSATVNEADDDKHYGFEWLRYDAPENMTPYKVSAPLYNGEIVGTLSGLNPDIYYKYRPFYKADDGTVFVGAWEAFLTGDANVTFAPEVHTKEPVALSDGKMILLLFCAEGTEAILEKGFEIIKKAIESFGTRADGGDITKVIVSGNEMSATIEGLEPGTEYICRSYVKTASGTTYGEDKTFKTPLPGDANNDDVVNVADIVEITNAKAGNSSASFILNNADMDGDGNLTEADINAIVNIIMQK